MHITILERMREYFMQIDVFSITLTNDEYAKAVREEKKDKFAPCLLRMQLTFDSTIDDLESWMIYFDVSYLFFLNVSIEIFWLELV